LHYSPLNTEFSTVTAFDLSLAFEFVAELLTRRDQSVGLFIRLSRSTFARRTLLH